MDKRTVQQNKALHKFFELVALQLNEAGLDMRAVLKKDVDIPWGKQSVKDFLWKPIQKALLNKDKTSNLKKKEIDSVYNVLNRHFGEKFGIYQPFPSIDQIIMRLNEEEKENKNSVVRRKTK